MKSSMLLPDPIGSFTLMTTMNGSKYTSTSQWRYKIHLDTRRLQPAPKGPEGFRGPPRRVSHAGSAAYWGIPTIKVTKEQERSEGLSTISDGRLLASMLALPGCVGAPADDSNPGTPDKQRPAEQQTPQQPIQAAAPAPAEAPRYSGPIAFTDVTGQAGIKFKHNSGAFGKKYLPETRGGAAAHFWTTTTTAGRTYS